MGRTVAIVNQKGGVGKTTVTLGMASAAQAAGHRVLVIDLDPQASSTWILGVDPAKVELSSAEVLGKGAIGKSIVPSAWGDGVDLIPGSSRLLSRESSANKDAALRLRAALAAVEFYDAVLIDCPPSLGNLTTNALAAANHALIVVEPSALSLRGISAVADTVDEVWDTHNPGLSLAGVIVNKVPGISNEADRRYDELVRIVGKRAIWQPVVPQRVAINEALGARRPIHDLGSRAADLIDAFDRHWAKLRRLTKA